MRNALTKLASMLSPEMYRVAVGASQKHLHDEIMIQSLTLVCDELGRELQEKHGYTDAEVQVVIMRGADRASMMADVALMIMADDDVTPADLLGHD